MENAKLIFGSNSSNFVVIKHNLVLLVDQLADINEFPVHAHQFLGAKGDFLHIAETLALLYDIYYDQVNQLGLGLAIERLGQKSMAKFMAEKDGKIEAKDLVIQMIIFDTDSLRTTDDYVGVRPVTSRVFEALPSLKHKLDKYGLVYVNSDFDLRRQGIIYQKTALINYHPFLRRYFTARFTETTSLLSKFSQDERVEVRIALDPFRLAKASHYHDIFEFDYWYGAPFAKEKLDDRNYHGVTVYTRPKDHRNNLTWAVDRTEVLVSNNKDGEKEFQIEEIRPASHNSIIYMLHKYVHFVWSPESNSIRHLDGAVKVYDHNEHAERLVRQWSRDFDGRVKTKIKLFRLDGDVELNDGIDLISHFFRYNELIHEFFGGEALQHI